MQNRKTLLSLALTGLTVCALFTGCSTEKGNTDEIGDTAWNLNGVEPKHLTEWPQNVFTEKILPPQNGMVDYVLDYADSDRYAVFVRDISSEESEQYIKELKDFGYSEVHSDGNDVSVGTVLESEEAYLSISYSDGELGVLITLREKDDQ